MTTERKVWAGLALLVLLVIAVMVHDNNVSESQIERIREQSRCERELIATGEFASFETVHAICAT